MTMGLWIKQIALANEVWRSLHQNPPQTPRTFPLLVSNQALCNCIFNKSLSEWLIKIWDISIYGQNWPHLSIEFDSKSNKIWYTTALHQSVKDIDQKIAKFIKYIHSYYCDLHWSIKYVRHSFLNKHILYGTSTEQLTFTTFL